MMMISRSGVFPLDDQWTHVVSGLLVVFGVSAIAVGELSRKHNMYKKIKKKCSSQHYNTTNIFITE